MPELEQIGVSQEGELEDFFAEDILEDFSENSREEISQEDISHREALETEDSQEQEPEPESGLEGKAEEAYAQVEVNGKPILVSMGQRFREQDTRALYGYEQASKELEAMRQQLTVVDGCAAIAGVSRKEYLETLERNLEQAYVEQVAQRQNLPPEAARRVLEAERKSEALFRSQQEQTRRQHQEQQRLAPYLELFRRYPEVREAGELPPLVGEQIRAGANPLVAYQDYLLTRQAREEQVRRQQEEVRRKSPGSIIGTQGDEELEGAFAAFDSVFS